MKEYTKQWIQFIVSWMFLIGIIYIGASIALNWYNSLPVGYQPDHFVKNIPEYYNVSKISIPEGTQRIANGVYRLPNGSLIGCKNSSYCEIFDIDKHRGETP